MFCIPKIHGWILDLCLFPLAKIEIAAEKMLLKIVRRRVESYDYVIMLPIGVFAHCHKR